MSLTETLTRYTPEDLLNMADEKSYELVDGRLVERLMGSKSSWIGGQLFRLIGNYCVEHHLGLAWPADTGYRCFPHDPNMVRKPDVSFIRLERLPGECPASGYERIAPDLAVEVLSPNDLASEIDQKVEDYLHAGVRLIWVVNPETRTVRILRPDGTDSRLHDTDELRGEDVLPGFSCPVREIFPAATQNKSKE